VHAQRAANADRARRLDVFDLIGAEVDEGRDQDNVRILRGDDVANPAIEWQRTLNRSQRRGGRGNADASSEDRQAEEQPDSPRDAQPARTLSAVASAYSGVR
jgi:hypothetical protein